ncbi:hypothetical protein ACWFQ8_29905 [Streptomyces sp. NPDC055254]
MEVVITITRESSWFIPWRYGWEARVPYGDRRDGFASTERRARAKAERTARRLLTKDVASYTVSASDPA